MILFTTACSSSKYGAHFRGYNEQLLSVSPIEKPANTLRSPLFDMDNSNLQAASARLTIQSGSATNATQFRPPQQINEPSVTVTRVELATPVNYRTSNQYSPRRKSLHVEKIKEMPRWRYLSMAGILLVSGILLVAFSSAATFLGVLATVAFTAALVYFILWMIKK